MSFDAWRQDLWYSLRFLRRNAGFSLGVALTFGLGVGATTAIFTVVSGVLLRPLPFPEPERLVSIQLAYDNKGPNVFIGSTETLEWQKRSRTMTSVAGYFDCSVNLETEQAAERLSCGAISASMLPTLRVQPLMGRNFLPEEDRPGGPPAAILSHPFWQQRRGGDPAIVGKSIRLDGADYRIAGVLPEDFRIPVEFQSEQDLWLPLRLSEGRENRRSIWAIARLGPGLSIKAARAELDSILQAMPVRRRSPTTVVLTPWQERITGQVKSTLLLFLASVGMVLAIACVNVANLLLSKSTGRRREMAVRRALGAGTAGIVRQLLMESALLALLGALAGLALAYVARDLLIAFLGSVLPTVPAIPFDARVLGFTLAVSAVCGVVFGLAPALFSARVPVAECLKDSARIGGGRKSLRDFLVVGEVALATALMIGAGLLFTSFVRLRGIHPGMPADKILTFTVEMKGAKYATLPAQREFFREVLRELRSIPGVEFATIATSGVISGSWTDGREYVAEWNAIDPTYFQMMGLRLLRGRNFTDGDGPGAPGVVIVSQSLARKYCPTDDCRGVRFPLPRVGGADIVGIVADRPVWGDREPLPAAYTNFLQADANFARALHLRAAGDPKLLIPAVRERLGAIDRSQAPARFQTLEERMAETVAPRRVQMLLLAAFAILATLLGAAGIYGVMSNAVARRTHEIGVRVALGAARSDIRSLIFRRGLLLIVLGEAVGIVGALALNRVIASMLFHTRPTDLVTYAAVAALWLAVGIAACSLPARRAMSVEPTVALRYE